jgi:hypothetical protein
MAQQQQQKRERAGGSQQRWSAVSACDTMHAWHVGCDTAAGFGSTHSSLSQHAPPKGRSPGALQPAARPLCRFLLSW